MKPRLLLLALLALAVCTVRPACAQFGGGGPPAVGVVKAIKQPLTETSEFVGRVQATDRVDLIARVTAFVEERLFIEGTEVKAGDLLYKLERGPFEADVQQKAAAVAQYNALLSNANIVLGRAKSLLNTPAGQRSTVDDAQAQQLSQAAQLMSAQAQLRASQINLDYTEIHAPISGKIGQTKFTIGNVVSPSSGALDTIVSQDPMYVLFPISLRAEMDLRGRYAEKGGFDALAIKIRLPDGTLYNQVGRLTYVDPSVATNTDTITLRATIANPAQAVPKPGQPTYRPLTDGEFVTVLVEGTEPIEVLGIPRAAVLSDQQGSYVYVVGADNKVELRRIQLGQSTPQTAVVSSGLKDGDTVVLEGLQRIRPGVVVNPAPASPPPTVPPASGTKPAGGGN